MEHAKKRGMQTGSSFVEHAWIKKPLRAIRKERRGSNRGGGRKKKHSRRELTRPSRYESRCEKGNRAEERGPEKTTGGAGSGVYFLRDVHSRTRGDRLKKYNR